MVETNPVPPLLPDHALAIGVTSYDGGVYYGITADLAAPTSRSCAEPQGGPRRADRHDHRPAAACPARTRPRAAYSAVLRAVVGDRVR